MKTIFITGATAGFGKAIAYTFAQHAWRLILNGRRQDRLEALATELRNDYGADVLTLPFDVRDREAVVQAIRNLPHEWKWVDLLVNNAGLASGLSTIQEGDFADWDVMLDTNVKGLLNVFRCIAPTMVERGQGHIINIGSIAGKQTYLRGNVYCATKAAVNALSEAMRIDMLPHGIRVTQICPGAAETEFSLVRFKGDAERAKQAYAGYKPLTAQDIADIVYFASTRPGHVVLNDIVVTPLAQASPYYMHKG
ncbi:MAG: SDR family NAD(P)-dependent oxidoreductase [Candidatus Pollutiaquabacter aromativorans]